MLRSLKRTESFSGMMSKEELLKQLSGYLVEMFEIPADAVTLDAQLSEDLDLDSIDAVDLIVKLQELTGKRISPDAFKSVRTVGDVIDSVHAIISE